MPPLTEALVERARPRAVKYEITCAALRGFSLRVLPSGKKVYYARRRSGGEDVRHRVGSARDLSLAEARQAALVLLGHVAPAPPAPAPSAPQLRRFAARFLAEHVDVYLKPSTRRRYRAALDRHLLPALGDVPLDAITPRDVAALHRAMRDAPYHANNTVRVLSSLLRHARAVGALDAKHVAPTRGLRLYRERARERFLSPDERRRLERVLADGEATPPGRRGAIRWSTAAAIRLLALTGMRRGEVLGLTWSMVDVRFRCLRLADSKTGPKVIPINSHALALIQSLERRRVVGCEHVVYSRRRGRIDPGSLESSWGAIRARAGLDDVRLHDLRHSAASDAINAGVPLEVIQRILGHRDIRTTQRYAHLARDVIAEGVERMAAAIELGRRGARG